MVAGHMVAGKMTEELTLLEVLAKIAVLKGWSPPETGIPTGPGTSWLQDSGKPLRFPQWLRVVDSQVVEWGTKNIPILASLDIASELMPKDWVIHIMEGPRSRADTHPDLNADSVRWEATGLQNVPPYAIERAYGDTEMLARFRLLWLILSKGTVS